MHFAWNRVAKRVRCYILAVLRLKKDKKKSMRRAATESHLWIVRASRISQSGDTLVIFSWTGRLGLRWSVWTRYVIPKVANYRRCACTSVRTSVGGTNQADWIQDLFARPRSHLWTPPLGVQEDAYWGLEVEMISIQ